MASDVRGDSFSEDVFPAELSEIGGRRRFHGLQEVGGDGKPSVGLGLTGLSFSGGGIRSASFCLGVVQRIARAGLLKHVDYLSTVSGGGYIGACLNSLLSDPDRSADAPFPFETEPGRPEPPALQHIRNGSRFLTPGGFLEQVRLPVMIARGAVLSFLVFLPLVMAAVAITEILYEMGPNPRVILESVPVEAWFLLLLIVTVPFLGRLTGRRFDWNFRNKYQLTLAALSVALVITIALIPLTHLVMAVVDVPWDDTRAALMEGRILDGLGIPRYWLWLGPLVLLAFVGLVARASTKGGQLASRLVLYLVGLLGPTLLGLLYLALCIHQIDSPYISPEFREDLERIGERPDVFQDTPEAMRFAFWNRGLVLGPRMTASLEESGGVDTVWVVQSAGGDVGRSTEGRHRIEYREDGRLRIAAIKARLFHPPEDLYFIILFVLLVLFNVFLMDVNTASLHGYYRDRLSRAFVFRVDASTGRVRANDTQKLSEAGPGVPYQLINAALNLQSSRDHSLRGRMAGFFLFSKRFIGSERTGYVPTESVEEVDSRLDLAAATAISGAAASPNMGASTKRMLTFIMTMLNLRLGYWLVNPRSIRAAGYLGRLLNRAAGPKLLLREAFGDLNERGRFVNLSDGGHIDNLGLYQLLRRRCRFIVAVDAGADRNSLFGDLAQLIRFAGIDLGITIHLDVDALRADEQGFSRCHAVIGSIDYGEGSSGTLLYLKSSVTGDEGELIRHYWHDNPAFPNQSTADQFFGEEDLEAYRSLGFHVCDSALTELVDGLPPECVEPVFDAWRAAVTA